MQRFSRFAQRSFKWLGESVSCPDENLLGKNYDFYSECEIDGTKYEIGVGVQVKIESVQSIGMIHYFYEIPNRDSVPRVRKHIAALELFYKPKEIASSLATPAELDHDLEVVKKDNVVLLHVPVFVIKSRCIVVYGLQDEDPQDLFHEFMTPTSDIIYVCRYTASFQDGLFYLKGAIEGTTVIKKEPDNSATEVSDDEQHLTAGKFVVDHIEENIACNIIIKLKRQSSPPEEDTAIKKPPVSTTSKKHVPLILAKKARQSPSELMKNLTLVSPRKRRELPSQTQVTNMNKNIKQMNKRKPILSQLEEHSDDDIIMTEINTNKLNKIDKNVNKPKVNKSAKIQNRRSSRIQITEMSTISSEEHSDDDIIMTEINTLPVVVLNKIDMNVNKPEVNKSARNQTRRSSHIQITDMSTKSARVVETPSRSSRRQTPKVSYEEFDSSPEKRSARTRFNKSYNDYVVSSPVLKKCIEHTPSKRNDEKATPKKKIKETPTKTKKHAVTFNETPKPNSVRQKRTVPSSVEVTPKKQSRIVSTPRSGRLNIMTMTPTVEVRDNPIVFCNTPMSRARMGLSAYTVPLKVPCRENEYLNIYNFVSGRLLDQSSGCMYISGVPGTGKTMTVCRVMNDLSNEKDDYSDFVFLKLNALALTEPRQIYVEIVKKLINKKLHWEESLKEIERFFKAKKKKVPHVILVDELDKLCNRKQDVVYNLLDLPFHSVTPLIVITIANTMDLPERILTNKVNSRLGLVRLTFKPYQYKDLVRIVTERLATDAVFKTEALELVARKVAAVSGDARRALAMCSRATEIAEEEDKELVTMDIVDKVLKEMSSSSKVLAIQCCSKLEKFVLTAIANEVTRTGNEEVPFMNMIHNLEKLCLFESFKLPSPEVCLKACHNLGIFRLLITQHGRTDFNMTLMLNISTDDIHYALRQK